MLADIFQTKLLDGQPAKFLRRYGPHKFVIEVDGKERAILRAVWRSLPFLDAGETIAGTGAPDDVTDVGNVKRDQA